LFLQALVLLLVGAIVLGGFELYGGLLLLALILSPINFIAKIIRIPKTDPISRISTNIGPIYEFEPRSEFTIA